MMSQKNTIKAISVFPIILIFFTFSNAFPVENSSLLIKNLNSNSPSTFKESILELHKMGKNAIPLLIDGIGCNKRIAAATLSNPMDSFLSFDKICSGVINAYLIELILAREEIIQKNFFESPFILGHDQQNYLYLKGFITNRRGKLINKHDMTRIKMILKRWWEKNKDKAIEQLRDDWKNNFRPLSGSGYNWGCLLE
jgi:hypothetical protein